MITAVAMNESVAVHMHCFSVWILSAFALFALAELIKEDEPLAGHTQSWLAAGPGADKDTWPHRPERTAAYGARLHPDEGLS